MGDTEIDMTVEEELEQLEAAEEEEDGTEPTEEESEEEPAGEEPEPEEEEEPEDPAIVELREQNRNLQGWAGQMRHQNKTLAEENEKLQARFGKILDALAEKEGIDVAELMGEQPAEEPIPDPDEDVTGHIVGSVRKALGEFKEELQTKEQQREQQAKLQQFTAEVKDYHEADAAAFAEEHPDYEAAERAMTDYVYNEQVRALSLRFPDGRVPVQDAQGQVAEMVDVETAAQRGVINLVADLQVKYALAGKSLAQATYERAQELGLLGEGSEPEEQPQKPRTAAQKLKAKKKKAGKSLAAASGGSAAKGGSLKNILDMNDDEFDEAIEGQNWRKIVKTVAGGA